MSSRKRYGDRGNLFDNMEASEFFEEVSPDETVYMGVSSLSEYAELSLEDMGFEEISHVPSYVEDVYDSPSIFLGVSGATIVAQEGSDEALEMIYLGISDDDMADIVKEGLGEMMEKGVVFDAFEDINPSDPIEDRGEVDEYVRFIENKDLGLID